MTPAPPASLPPATRAVLDGIAQQFRLSDNRLLAITEHFVADFALGLGAYSKPMAMIPTFVTGVPDGTEQGTFLALDLGGTNLRVCEVVLDGNKNFTLRQQKYRVSEVLKTGEATALFDYLADSVDAFLTENGNALDGDEALSLGLTFSFPVEQTALDEGLLLTWTKGFSAKNAIGKDVVKLLQDAFDRKHIHVKCVALVNDTVGALLSRAYTSGGCLLGAIFGTGTNGAYVEDVAKITKLRNSPAAAAGGKMIVNTEWGAFNNTRSILPTTPYDNKVDRESINPRFQAYEKFISGLYLGEITRNVLLALVDAAPPLLFGGTSTAALNAHYGLDTALLSAVEAAPAPADVRAALGAALGLAPADVSDDDAEIVRWACATVATRAAKLSGCAVAAVLVQTGHARLGGGAHGGHGRRGGRGGRGGGHGAHGGHGRDRIIVGVDGSLVQFYPGFEERLRDSLRAIVGAEVEKRVEIGLAKDGSGVGAALCALQAMKQVKTAEPVGE